MIFTVHRRKNKEYKELHKEHHVDKFARQGQNVVTPAVFLRMFTLKFTTSFLDEEHTDA